MLKSMTTYLKYTIGFVLALSLSVAAQAELTLEEALKIGLQNNYSIRIARNNAQVAQNNSGKGRVGLLPTVAATASVRRAESDEESNSPNSLEDWRTDAKSAQVALDWTLFDGFKMFAEKRRYRELDKLGQQQARSIIESNLVAISRAYYNLVAQEQLLEVAKSSEEISAVRLEKAKVRREIGGSSSTDFLNAQVSYNADHSSLLDRELATVVARQELNLLLGREAEVPLRVSPTLSIPELATDLPDLHQQAEAHNADLMVIEAQKQVASAGLVTNRSRFMPKLSLTGSYAWSDRDQITDDPNDQDFSTETTEQSIGLNMNWNLFNGGSDRIDWQNAKVDFNNQQLALMQARQQLSGDLRAQFETYNRRKALVEIENQNVQAANQNLEIMTDRYEMGGATSLEFRDAQLNLNRAKTNLITARHQTRIAHLEIQRLTGSLSVE